MRIGIVGAEAAKFTKQGEQRAKEIIWSILQPGDIVVSGHCHLGGVDIWAEEAAVLLGLDTLIFPPKVHSWSEGYRPRNQAIAEYSDYVLCIAVDGFPPNYRGLRFPFCYHCGTKDHVKSGGCWTTKYARSIGVWGETRVVEN